MTEQRENFEYEAGDPTAAATGGDLQLGQKVPNQSEHATVGAATIKIQRNIQAFTQLVKNENLDILFKDEEGTGADRMITSKLAEKVNVLAALVKSEWVGVKLRITEARDENNEHSANSTHYEARGVDMTTSDQDAAKLGRLGRLGRFARLAVQAGFEWVFFENSSHVHASMSK